MATVLSPYYDYNNQQICEFDVVRVPDIPMRGKVIYCDDLDNPWRIVSSRGEVYTLEPFAPRCVVIPEHIQTRAVRNEPRLPSFLQDRSNHIHRTYGGIE